MTSLMEISGRDRRRRAEAARAYAEIGSQDELGRKLGYKPPTYKRHLNGEGGTLELKDLLKIAEVCGVPDWFMLAGWEGAEAASAPPEGEDELGRPAAGDLGPLPDAGEGGAEPDEEEETGS